MYVYRVAAERRMANGEMKTKKRAKQRGEAQKPKQKCVKNNGEKCVRVERERERA